MKQITSDLEKRLLVWSLNFPLSSVVDLNSEKGQVVRAARPIIIDN